WQLDRLHQRRAANAIALAARAAPVVSLQPEEINGRDLSGRRVRATGHYDHTHDVVLRGKAYNGAPGVEIVSPLVLEDGRSAVLVHRGFMPTPDAVTVQTDSVREFGKVRVEGIAEGVGSGNGNPLSRGGATTWARLDLDALSATMQYQLAPVYIRQTPDSALPRFPRRLEPPPIDDGPHLNYAIQWFAFAGMAVVFGAVIWYQKRERDEDKRER
ncbi:MAG TPA: SURF1 family protein, partial [Gemmatimonadales bacterium]|nr:SURF1 family protein [Gemmatimonadales bacterium]